MSFFKFFKCCNDAEEVLEDDEKDKKEFEKHMLNGRSKTLQLNSNENDTINLPQEKCSEKQLNQDQAQISLSLSPSINNSYHIPDEYLFDKEKLVLPVLNKSAIISFFDSLESLPKFEFHLYKSTNLNFYVTKKGSKLSNSYFALTDYIIPKSELYQNIKKDVKLTLEDLNDMYHNIETRKKWDEGILEFEDLKIINENIKVIHMTYKSPIIGVDNRDVVDKIIAFRDGDCFYCYRNSIPEELGLKLAPVKEDTTRAFNYINLTKYWEDGGNIYMKDYYQIDYRINVAESILQLVAAINIKKYMKKFFMSIRKVKLHFTESNSDSDSD